MKTITNILKTTFSAIIFLTLLTSTNLKAQLSIIDNISDYNGTEISCYGLNDGWITVTPIHPNGNVTYLWSTGDTTPYVTNLVAGSYELWISDATSNLHFIYELAEPQQVQVQLIASVTNHGYNLFCNGDNSGSITAIASGGVGGKYSYDWSNGSVLSTETDLAAGVYEVTATDENGCVGTSTQTLVEPDPIVVTLTTISQPTTISSFDGTISAVANGGQGVYSFYWNNGQTTNTAINLSATYHKVRVMDEEGCFSGAAIQLTSQSGFTSPVGTPNSIPSQFSGFVRATTLSPKPMILNNDIKNEGVMINNVENFQENSLLISDMMGNVRLRLENVKTVNQLDVNLETGHYVAVLTYKNEAGEIETVTNQISIR